MPTLETTGIAFGLEFPRRRCITLRSRRWSLGLALGEFCWHASGRDDVESIAYYAKRWAEFSDDGHRIVGSCYGRRIFRAAGDGGASQWERAKRLIRQDTDSRRVILNFQDDRTALSTDAKDAACASTMQFLVRDSKVDAIVYMRSNDVFLGLPYDLFVFTMLQELFAAELGLDVGRYHQMVGSLHLYESDLARARNVWADKPDSIFEMPPMTRPGDLVRFLSAEARIRQGQHPAEYDDLSAYWRELAYALRIFRASRDHRPSSAVQLSTGSRYADLLLPDMKRSA
jgi:thymidylate synthase